MFFNFLNAVLGFDIAWFVWLIEHNLFYVFAFITLCFFFWGNSMKKAVIVTVLLSIVAWAWVDFELISGWVLFAGGFLSIYYVTKMVIMVFAESMPSLKNKLILVSEIQFFALLIIYNLFLR